MRGENGFVRNFCEFGAEGLEALEILDGAAVVAFGLGLIAKEEFPGLRMLGELNEAFGQGEVLLLRARHLQAGIAEIGVQQADGFGIGGAVEAGGEEAAFHAGGAQEVLLVDGDAFHGIELLAVDGPVDGDEVGAELENVVEAFEDGYGEVGGGEAVLAAVLGRSGFAFGGAGARGTAGIGLVGGDLSIGDFLRHGCSRLEK